MKKKIAAICALVMIFTVFAPSVGAINVIMNSSYLKFPDQEPVVENGVTLVPLRTIAEALGLEVTWDDPTDTVVIKKDNFFVELVIGSTTAKTSGGVKTLPAAPKIINSRTMVPLRFIAEEMGLTVLWNEKYQRVVINGQVDTQTVLVLPTENVTDVENPDAVEPEEAGSDEDFEAVEEETEFVDDSFYAMFSTSSSQISFAIPNLFLPEDTELEESFAYRSLDAFDAQHTLDWESVTLYESYADEAGINGILYVVQELAPYEGEEYDVSAAFDEYPESPERPRLENMEYIFSEANRILVERLCADLEIEIPEGYEEMDDEQLALALGFESEQAMSEFTAGYDIQELMMEIPEYADYWVAYEEYGILKEEYNNTVKTISGAKAYIIRNFSAVASQKEDDVWAEYFTSYLNSDSEVRYEGVEIIDFDGKKVVHATIYAEDPDDEQGTYDYYLYFDGDFRVTIWGGTLNGTEPSPEIIDAFTTLNIQ